MNVDRLIGWNDNPSDASCHSDDQKSNDRSRRKALKPYSFHTVAAKLPWECTEVNVNALEEVWRGGAEK